MYTEIEKLIPDSTAMFDKAIDHLKNELIKVRTGKASTSILDGILVEYYGSNMPINQVANVGLADAKTITIQPWERKMLPVIEQSIFAANIGLTPQNDGEFIRITIPALTEERRKDLVKQVKHLGEETRIGIRSERHKILDFIKKEVKEGYPEDAGKRLEDKIQELITRYYEKINSLLESKEEDIMTI
jgi:ribosome recycling factor